MRSVVVGAGLAGLTAALRLAEGGERVTLLSAGVGGLHLSPGVIDVAGYTPELAPDPRRGAEALAGNGGGHPYAAVGVERVAGAIRWFRDALPECAFVGDLDRNLRLPTAVGSARPTALAPESMASGDVTAGARYAVVGFRVLKDLHPALVAENLSRAGDGISARSVTLTTNPRIGEAEVSAVAFARAMDDSAFRAHVAEELRPKLEPGEVVGMPAVVGLEDAPAAWRDVQERLGTTVFEIPLAPPSVPGIRLYEALTGRLRAAGVRIVMGTEVTGAELGPNGIAALTARAANRDRTYPGDAFVFASGGLESGAITVDSYGRTRERVFDLPLTGVPVDGTPRFDPDYWGDHPLLRAGVAVDREMRPVGSDGAPVHGNLHAAGGLLAGAVPWREKSGEGIAIATAVVAAEAILQGRAS